METMMRIKRTWVLMKLETPSQKLCTTSPEVRQKPRRIGKIVRTKTLKSVHLSGRTGVYSPWK
jgi:hypothetical protein